VIRIYQPKRENKKKKEENVAGDEKGEVTCICSFNRKRAVELQKEKRRN